jgi:hypothetical protein
MAPLRIRATPELIEQQRAQQQPEDAASQASTASQPDEDNDETFADGCIPIDTIEAYTANVQNKKRIFAEEVLNVV